MTTLNILLPQSLRNYTVSQQGDNHLLFRIALLYSVVTERNFSLFKTRPVIFGKPAPYLALLASFLIGLSVMSIAAPASALVLDDIPWLSNLKTGLWEVKDRRSGELVDKVCVRDPKQLLQLRHTGPLCRRDVLRQDATHAYVYYQCGAKGHGYTNIIMEGSNLMQITSQGLYENSPFQFSAEARHVGACSSS